MLGFERKALCAMLGVQSVRLFSVVPKSSRAATGPVLDPVGTALTAKAISTLVHWR